MHSAMFLMPTVVPLFPSPVLPELPLVGALRQRPALSVVSKPGTSSLFLIVSTLPRPREDRHVKNERCHLGGGFEKVHCVTSVDMDLTGKEQRKEKIKPVFSSNDILLIIYQNKSPYLPFADLRCLFVQRVTDTD